MSNDMKLIIENWRKFSNNTSLSNILIETKNYNSSLHRLNEEYDSKIISKNTYNQIILESIDKDFKELDLLLNNKKILNELKAFDAAKNIAKGAVNSVVQKINNIFAKALSLIKTNSKKALEVLQKVQKYLDNFAKNNPELTKKFVSAVKIAAVLAIAYYVLSPSVAHGYIELPATSSRPAATLGSDTAAGKQIVDFLSNNAKLVIDSLGLNSTIIDNIIAAIKSKNPVKVGESVINVLQQIRAMAERTEFIDSFKPLIDNAISTASNLGDQAGNTSSAISDIVKSTNAKSIINHYMDSHQIQNPQEMFGISPRRILSDYLSSKNLKMSDLKPEQVSKLIQNITIAMGR